MITPLICTQCKKATRPLIPQDISKAEYYCATCNKSYPIPKNEAEFYWNQMIKRLQNETTR